MTWFQGMSIFGIFGSLLMALPAAIFWIGGESPGAAFLLSIPPFGLLYWSLAALLNRTKVTVSNGMLSSRAGPIP